VIIGPVAPYIMLSPFRGVSVEGVRIGEWIY
jgi:hypothetical protein